MIGGAAMEEKQMNELAGQLIDKLEKDELEQLISYLQQAVEESS